jgi:uncharacterized protein YlaI
MIRTQDIRYNRHCSRCGRATEQQLQQTHVTAEATIPVWICLNCRHRVAVPHREAIKALRKHGAAIFQLPLHIKALDYLL